MLRLIRSLLARQPLGIVALLVAIVVSTGVILGNGTSASAGAVFENRPEGLVIVDVAPGSPAEAATLRPGGVVTLAPAANEGTLVRYPDGTVLEYFDARFMAGGLVRQLALVLSILALAAITALGGRRPAAEVAGAATICASVIGPVWGMPAVGLLILVQLSALAVLWQHRGRLAVALGVGSIAFLSVAITAPRGVPWGLLPGLIIAVGFIPLGADGIGGLSAAWRRAGIEGGRRPRLSAVAAEADPLARRHRTAAADGERTRLASELHAVVLPELAAAAAIAGPIGLGAIDRIQAASTSLRSIISERYVPLVDDLGLLAALELLAEGIEDRSGLTVVIEPEVIGQPPVEVERAAFRIAQLAVDNVVAHAEATGITIGIESSAGRLRLIVSDDGRGVGSHNAAMARQAGHVGFADMERRAAIVGGRVHVRAGNDGGTRIELVWPA